VKVCALLVAPANYTVSLIKHVYVHRGVSYVFLTRFSEAVQGDASDGVCVLDELSPLRRLRKMLGLLKSYDCFVVNGYTQPTFVAFLLLNILLFRKPFAIESDTELRIPRRRLKRLLKWSWLHWLFTRSCAYGFAGGNFSHRELFTHYGMAYDHVTLAPMMVDNAKYQRSHVPLPGEKFRFGYLGRLIKLKQVDRVIAAYKKVKEKCPNIELCIVGDGDCREGLARETVADETIKFLGAKFGDEKTAALHSFDCLVLYSRYESWGLVVNEALASGIPCIVSDKVGAVKDLILGINPTGLVADSDDVEELAQAMGKMACDRTLWKTFSDNALARMSHWNYDLYARNFDAWLKKVGQS